MARQDRGSQSEVPSDMEISSSEEDTIYPPAAKPSAKPAGDNDLMKNGADFIALEFNNDDDLGNVKKLVDRKRKRSPDRDSEDDQPAFPENCPWMGRTVYSDMRSVPVMLTQELKDFVRYISPTEEEHKVRLYVLEKIKRSVQSIWPGAQVNVFGSFDTKLYLPTSDMDIVVLLDKDITKQDLFALARHFRTGKVGVDIRPVVGARVPLVKFKETATGIPVDISFNITSGVQSADAIRKYLGAYPGLRSLAMIIKHFLTLKGQNEPFLGGLGSYTTILMILSFLQMHPQIQAKVIDAEENLGVLLIEFFELYGLCFNYHDVGIAVTGGGSYFDKQRQYTSVRTANKGNRQGSQAILLRCIDPNDPLNDTASSSYNFKDVRKAFVAAFMSLTQNVQRRNRHLFGPQDRNDGRSGVKRKGKGTVQQVSLIGDVLSVPHSTLEHRRHIRKLFYDGTLQKQLKIPLQFELAANENMEDQGVVTDKTRERETELATADGPPRKKLASGRKKPVLDKVVAPRIAPLRDVQFIHADDSEEEDGAYFDNLLQQGAAEYGDSDQDDAEDGGGSKQSVFGHNDPRNVHSSEDSITLPQLSAP